MAIHNDDDRAGDEQPPRQVFSKQHLTGLASRGVWRIKQHTPELNIFLFGLQAIIVLLIVGVIVVGYRAPSKTVNQSVPTSVLNPATLNVDQVVEASVATSIAQVAGMPTDIYDSVSS
ncbi:MAG TPA: hypothetical protein VNG90_01080, partial [Candidatus Acidoferrum sp.]|nr:hypothetical protein [Candidatus Acidoferrum sp.]